jgi:hypothetical protein
VRTRSSGADIDDVFNGTASRFGTVAEETVRVLLCDDPAAGSLRIGAQIYVAPDDEPSSRRRARDRRIAGAVRESVQPEVGVEVQQRCFQRQSISRGRAI